MPFDKHGYWFVTADIIAHQPKRDKRVAENGNSIGIRNDTCLVRVILIRIMV